MTTQHADRETSTDAGGVAHIVALVAVKITRRRDPRAGAVLR